LNGRSSKNRYIDADIYTYPPERTYDVIVFGDSLYYVPQHKIPAMLDRYSNTLKRGGVFIARIKGVRAEWWEESDRRTELGRGISRILAHHGSWARRRAILAMVESKFSIVERELHHFEESICVIVFQPRHFEPAWRFSDQLKPE